MMSDCGHKMPHGAHIWFNPYTEDEETCPGVYTLKADK